MPHFVKTLSSVLNENVFFFFFFSFFSKWIHYNKIENRLMRLLVEKFLENGACLKSVQTLICYKIWPYSKYGCALLKGISVLKNAWLKFHIVQSNFNTLFLLFESRQKKLRAYFYLMLYRGMNEITLCINSIIYGNKNTISNSIFKKDDIFSPFQTGGNPWG